MSDAIEKIYNAHVADEKLKKGTKYERLTAIVFKVLTEENTIIHDLKLKGDGKSSYHQIDVTVEKHGTRKRILLECKDYDQVVGIGIVRDFYGAVAQIKPEEAIVITTKGFTKGAVAFAKDEGISLAILKKLVDEDLENRIRTIVLKMRILSFANPLITSWISANEENRLKFNQACASMTGQVVEIPTASEYFLNAHGQRIESFRSYLEPFFNSLPREANKTLEGEHLFPQARYINMGGELIGIAGFVYRVDCHESIIESVTNAGEKVAVLILKMLDGSLDRLFFDVDISAWTFAGSGEVIRNYCGLPTAIRPQLVKEKTLP